MTIADRVQRADRCTKHLFVHYIGKVIRVQPAPYKTIALTVICWDINSPYQTWLRTPVTDLYPCGTGRADHGRASKTSDYRRASVWDAGPAIIRRPGHILFSEAAPNMQVPAGGYNMKGNGIVLRPARNGHQKSIHVPRLSTAHPANTKLLFIHLYKTGPTSKTFGRRCRTVIQLFSLLGTSPSAWSRFHRVVTQRLVEAGPVSPCILVLISQQFSSRSAWKSPDIMFSSSEIICRQLSMSSLFDGFDIASRLPCSKRNTFV